RGDSTNIEEESYTFEVYRIPNLYVSAPESTPPGSAAGDGSHDAPYDTIQKALEKAKTFDLADIPGAEVAIIISGTITAVSGAVTNDGMVVISGSGYPAIVLKGADTGTNAINASGKNKRVLYIGDGNTVRLEDNLILKGGSFANGSGVYVTNGGKFTMTGGSIQNNTSGDSRDGGVSVASGGEFTMTGGYIQGNSANVGGGVSVASGGKFTMTGGYIKNNTAANFGGGVNVTSGKFTMTGGYIQDNSASTGGGVYVAGVGAIFTKTGGTIYGGEEAEGLKNTAGTGPAVYLNFGKKRDTTADENVNLYAAYNDGWSYNDTTPGGAGNTIGNWH
ncbi:MAG: hypothetical protein LBK64_04505, partial [Spirochaetaceae bacterium]|nr:hypothetical protein [Spirochaetaceae bacterium]